MRQSRQRPQQSRLPCPVIAQDHMKLAGIKFSANTTEGGEAPELLYESCDDKDGGTGERCQRVRHKK
jgi:hypothetical protein